MDRGRAGGYITDNNYFGIQVKRKQREDHLRRLEKIKHRKPGTSSTLDNSAPNVAKSIAEDPRKASQSHSFNYITEKENRSLLKRISLILTAPPKITDKDYQEMKKLCKSAKDGMLNNILYDDSACKCLLSCHLPPPPFVVPASPACLHGLYPAHPNNT